MRVRVRRVFLHRVVCSGWSPWLGVNKSIVRMGAHLTENGSREGLMTAVGGAPGAGMDSAEEQRPYSVTRK
jgi:hypothetical protein